jgi:hypothetical protein
VCPLRMVEATAMFLQCRGPGGGERYGVELLHGDDDSCPVMKLLVGDLRVRLHEPFLSHSLRRHGTHAHLWTLTPPCGSSRDPTRRCRYASPAHVQASTWPSPQPPHIG